LAPSFKPRGPRYGASSGTIVKIALLGLVNAVVIAALPAAFAKPDYPIAIASISALLVIDVVYLSRRRWKIPLKYLVPGTIFLLVFAVYPIIYLIFISTTNYGTGNNLTKDQVIERIESNSVSASDDAIRYDLQILALDNPNGDLAFLLTDTNGNVSLGTADDFVSVPADDFVSVPADELVEQGTRLSVDGYFALNLGQANDQSGDISAFRTEGPTGTVRSDGFRTAFAQQQNRAYDPQTDTITDSTTGVVHSAEGGYFTNDDGDQLLPGWRASVGIDNYERLITDENTRDSRLPLDDCVLGDVGAVVVRTRTDAPAGVQRHPDERATLLPEPDHHPVRDPELHDRARVARHAQPTVRGGQPMARHQPAVARRRLVAVLLDPARQHLARVPVHVPRVQRRPAEHP